MWSTLRFRSLLHLSPSSHASTPPLFKPGFLKLFDRSLCLTKRYSGDASGGEDIRGINDSNVDSKYLTLPEIENVLTEVKADDVKVIPLTGLCGWTDYMVLATGRSAWHVRNIAEALIYQTKEKQRGAKHLALPTIQGQRAGNWIVLDSGRIVIHAFSEDARAYYGLERLYTRERSVIGVSDEDVRKTFADVGRPGQGRRTGRWKKSPPALASSLSSV